MVCAVASSWRDAQGSKVLFEKYCYSKVGSSAFSMEDNVVRLRDIDRSPNSNEVDWHPADVWASLKKRGHSLKGLSVAHGYHPTAAGKALKQPWPAMETIIAQALELSPETIWPNRYRS
jgi:Ner family transcriptional regulator